VRAREGVLLVAVSGLMALPSASAADWCGEHDRKCVRMTVPLDHAGKFPGTVSLRFERTRWKSVEPPLFVIAGEPGASSTYTFSQQDFEQLMRHQLSKRGDVVIDVRGTGRSSPLRCPSLQRPRKTDLTEAAAACAQAIGPRRDYYTAIDAAYDVEAVRRRLGVPRIAIYGVAYGARVALAYARLYPSQVERLVLQSPPGADAFDPFERWSMRTALSMVSVSCQRACRRFTKSAAADVTELALRLQQQPVSGYVVRPDGRRRPASIDSSGLLALMAAGPFVPGAVRAALDGDPAQLLRLRVGAATGQPYVSRLRELSAAAAAIAVCGEADLPWSDGTPISSRRAAATAFVDGLPSDAFSPFGARAALGSETLAICEGWPTSRRATQPAMGPLPDVPALVIAGRLDPTASVADAKAVAALFPRGQLMLVRNGGREIDTVHDDCLAESFRRFLVGGEAGSCAKVQDDGSWFPPPPPAPVALSELRPLGGAPGRPGRTAHAALLTLADIFPSLLFSSDFRIEARSFRAGALRGGSYSLRVRGEEVTWRLRRASFVPGVRVTGHLHAKGRKAKGLLRVRGPAAAPGRLTLQGERMTGRLGGRRVSFGLGGRAAARATISQLGSGFRIRSSLDVR
jgi:pimeloyl-ACP methyl ester carboxylesterase